MVTRAQVYAAVSAPTMMCGFYDGFTGTSTTIDNKMIANTAGLGALVIGVDQLAADRRNAYGFEGPAAAVPAILSQFVAYGACYAIGSTVRFSQQGLLDLIQ